ncbi:MAG: TetR/AcrR family transcriptional regulator [Peptostreptococcaceae bacterium]|nr:TetR/AcrR family transcriptional regulator [Peptostreptococcaceae bacterium]
MKKEERREQILEAAMKLFVEKGYKGTTTLQIAKEAEITEVTLFRHFSSKQEILLEGIEPILFSTLEGAINISKESSGSEMIESILSDRITLISKNYQVIKLILMEDSLLTELGRGNFINRILEILKNLLTEMGASEEDNKFALRLLMGTILSVLYMPDKNEEDIKDYIGKITNIIVQEINK